MKFIGQDDKETIFSRFRSHVSSGKADFFKSVGIDFVFGRREGPFVWDATSGKRLINCHCNGGVFNLGHRHPRIISALKESLAELDIGNHREDKMLWRLFLAFRRIDRWLKDGLLRRRYEFILPGRIQR